MNTRLMIWLVLPAVAGLLIAPAWAGDDKASKKSDSKVKAEIGKPAPEFTLKDLDGKEHKLSQYKGKIVVLEWTNHKCPYVVHHQGKARTMQKTAEKFDGKEVIWLAIDSSHYCKKQSDTIKKFAEDNEVTAPILLDAAGMVGKAYGARTTPHMFVIDKEGILIYNGAIDDNPDPFSGTKSATANYVVMAVEASMADKDVKTASTRPYGCSVKYAKLANR